MRKCFFTLGILGFTCVSFAGFKVKLVKPKKPDQFQASTTVAGVTFAADLIVDGKQQKDYFYKELTPSNIIAVRLAVFNGGKEEVALPLDGIQLLGPDGQEAQLVAPDTVAQAVLQGQVVTAEMKDKRKVAVAPNVRYGDPRYDRSDPRYDPRLDPSDPTYDPTDPRNRRNDPNDPRNRGYGRNNGPWARPGVDVVLNPGSTGGGGGDLSEFEKKLVEKDFQDKAHSPEPIVAPLARDKFLYFSAAQPPPSAKGFTLRLPAGKGIPQEILLKF